MFIDDDGARRSPVPAPGISRRTLLRVGAGGGLALFAAPLLAACKAVDKTSSGGAAAAVATGVKDTGSYPTPFGTVTADDVKKLFGTIDPASSGAGKTVKIGASMALSGPLSFYGNVMSQGINLAVEHIKAMGGPTFEIVYKDNKSADAQTSVSLARELSGSGVEFLFSSIGASAGTMLPVIAQEKLFTINVGSAISVPPYLGAGYYWEPDGDVKYLVPLITAYIKDTWPDAKRIAFIADDSGPQTNATVVDLHKQAFASAGLELVTSQFLPFGTTDFSGAISNVSGQKPDVVIASVEPTLGNFMKQYTQAGLTAPVVSDQIPPTPDDLAAGGDALTGVSFAAYFFNPYAPSNPWGQFFLQEWDQKYGHKKGYPDLYGTNYYWGTFLFWELMRKVWATGAEPTADALNQIMSGGTELFNIQGGDKSSLSKVAVDGTTHFAKAVAGVYQITSEGTFAQVASTQADGTGFQRV